MKGQQRGQEISGDCGPLISSVEPSMFFGIGIYAFGRSVFEWSCLLAYIEAAAMWLHNHFPQGHSHSASLMPPFPSTVKDVL